MVTYRDNAWGKYYQGGSPATINVSSLDFENTLALYLYGALSRPDDPAKQIREQNSDTLTVVIANFRQVVKEGDMRIHPIVTRLVDPEALQKMGAKTIEAAGGGAAVVRKCKRGMPSGCTSWRPGRWRPVAMTSQRTSTVSLLGLIYTLKTYVRCVEVIYAD